MEVVVYLMMYFITIIYCFWVCHYCYLMMTFVSRQKIAATIALLRSIWTSCCRYLCLWRSWYSVLVLYDSWTSDWPCANFSTRHFTPTSQAVFCQAETTDYFVAVSTSIPVKSATDASWLDQLKLNALRLAWMGTWDWLGSKWAAITIVTGRG